MEKQTVKALKSWSKQNKSLAETVCLAKAFAELEKERVKAYAVPLFANYEFYEDLDGASGKKVTDPDRLWLSDDNEKAAVYYAELDKLHREHGFDGPEGHCPALIAESLLTKAENALLELFGEFSGVGDAFRSANLELRAKALDLALSVCLSKSQD